MATLTINAGLESPEVQAAFRHWAQLGRDSTPLMASIGEGLVTNVQDRFRTELDPDGTRWTPLQEPWASLRRAGPILSQSGFYGGLASSIASDAANGEVSVGSNRIYAGVHQFGATIKPKNGTFLVFRDAAGAAFGGARQVTIPARPYLGIGPEDEDSILDDVEVFYLRFRRVASTP